jgi:hypothetical protein
VAIVTTSLALVVPCCSSEYVAVCHWWNDHRTPDQDAALLEWALALAKDRRIPVAGLPPRALRVTVRGCTSCASCVVACGGCCAGCSAPHTSSAFASRDRPRTTDVEAWLLSALAVSPVCWNGEAWLLPALAVSPVCWNAEAWLLPALAVSPVCRNVEAWLLPALAVSPVCRTKVARSLCGVAPVGQHPPPLPPPSCLLTTCTVCGSPSCWCSTNSWHAASLWYVP